MNVIIFMCVSVSESETETKFALLLLILPRVLCVICIQRESSVCIQFWFVTRLIVRKNVAPNRPNMQHGVHPVTVCFILSLVGCSNVWLTDWLTDFTCSICLYTNNIQSTCSVFAFVPLWNWQNKREHTSYLLLNDCFMPFACCSHSLYSHTSVLV